MKKKKGRQKVRKKHARKKNVMSSGRKAEEGD